MDVDQIERREIQLEETTPLWLRLCISGSAVFFFVCAVYEFVAEPDAQSWNNAAKLLAIIFVCGLFVANALFRSDVRWTIRSNEIQIDKAWIYDRQEVEFVRIGEITEIEINSESDDSGDRFYIRLGLGSGQEIKSPPIANAKRANEVKAEIEKRLGIATA
jgi:hypothetical protein